MNGRRGFLIVLAASAWLVGCGRKPFPGQVRLTAAGEPVLLTVGEDQRPRIAAMNALLTNYLGDLGMRFDDSRLDSEIQRINRLARTVNLPISLDMYQALYHARALGKRTGGLFDITIRPVTYAWGFDGGVVPLQVSAEALENLKFSYGPGSYTLIEYGIELNNTICRLDLGGMVDGFLTDRAIQRLRANFYGNLLLQVGQSYRALGTRDGAPWTVDLPEPFLGEAMLGEVRIGDGQGLSHSHAYSDYRRRGREVISHIIDPRDGFPVTQSIFSAVLATTATETDVLATALLIAGREGAPALMGQFPGAEALLVPNGEDRVIWMTPGFQERFRLLDAGYRIEVLERILPEPEPEPEFPDRPDGTAPPSLPEDAERPTIEVTP